jgi:hypothetical protein
MITQTQIVRLIEAQEYSRLADRLLSNGRCHSAQAIDRLARPEAAAPVALGLGLQRLCELTYWPHPHGAGIAHRLVRIQRRDGSFVSGTESSADATLAVTATALRGLIDWLAQHDHSGRNDDRLALIRNSIDRAWHALAAAFATARASDQWDHVAWAIVLWQLGDCDDARLNLPIDRIRREIEDSSAAPIADDLTRLALTMAA